MSGTTSADVIDRPRAVLVTGEPGSGKTTLATRLARELRVPMLARDDVRCGLLMTAGAWGDELVRVPAAAEAVEVFLGTAEALLGAGVSCVLEYVVRAQRPADFDRLAAVADLVVVVTHCRHAGDRVRERNSSDRFIANPAVLAATGCASVAEHTEGVVLRVGVVAREMRTEFGVPTARVSTDDGLRPPLDDLIAFVTQPPSRS